MKIAICLTLAAAVLAFQVASPEDTNFKFHGFSEERWIAEYLMPLDASEDKLAIDFTNAPEDDLSSYDNRKDEAHAKCVHPVRDQGSCGSCWAFATSEMASDRFCIENDGDSSEQVVFSPQDLVDCDHVESGCMGAATQRVVGWIAENGITRDACHPYEAKEFYSRCPQDTMKYDCRGDGANVDNTRWLKGATPTIFQGAAGPAVHITEIQAAIREGPAYLSMQVMSDFMNYSGGIFESATGRSVGGHAVKVVGYGADAERVEAGKSYEDSHYWICANSWSQRWGEEGGYFRIYMNQKIGYNAGWLDNFPEAKANLITE